MDKRFAIFDMDGTLVDSMGYWTGLAEEYLAGLGIREIPEDLPGRLMSMTMAQGAALLIQTFGLTVDAGELVAQQNAVMAEHYRRDIPLKPGVREYLGALRARGVSMCVASATAEPLVEACLTRLGIRDFFQFVLSCESLGVSKERPDIFHLAARRLGAEPGEVAVYEDALHAARTAKGAGYYLVAVYDESARDRWEELQSLADEALPRWQI